MSSAEQQKPTVAQDTGGALRSWSWRIARVAGIPIYVHWTFLILIGWLLLSSLSAGRTIQESMGDVGFILALFGCVVLHELGHALTAKRFGVKTIDITLLPIGGVARLQRMPEQPVQEFLIAIAGPAVNVLIAGVLYLLRARVADVTDEAFLLKGDFAGRLLIVNVFLAVFNLIPAFPMDGGRILRALLAMAMPYPSATRIAAAVGQIVAIGFGFLGLYTQNVILILIALFVWIGAQSEAMIVQERAELGSLFVRQAMLTDFKALSPDATLGQAAELLLAGSQADFPVMDGDRAVGVLTRAGLVQGLSQLGRGARVSDAPLAPIASVEATSALAPAVGVLREKGLPCLHVTEGGRLVGLLTIENISELLMVRAALGERPTGARP